MSASERTLPRPKSLLSTDMVFAARREVMDVHLAEQLEQTVNLLREPVVDRRKLKVRGFSVESQLEGHVESREITGVDVVRKRRADHQRLGVSDLPGLRARCSVASNGSLAPRSAYASYQLSSLRTAKVWRRSWSPSPPPRTRCSIPAGRAPDEGL